jgi:chorismate synthase
MVFRFLSAGESHGPELNIIIEGIPSNLNLLAEDINIDLKRRQGGYGRGGRMKIEKDQVIFTGGVRHGRTFGGAPISLKIINKDHEKWLNVMNAAPVDVQNPQVKAELTEKFISKVRPGHADFAGALKYDARDIRDILERSSARETTSRVAAGAVCKKFLSEFGIDIFSHVLQIGEISAQIPADYIPSRLKQSDLIKFKELVESSELRTFDRGSEERFKAHIDEIRKQGDSVGGLVEVFAVGIPVGLGSHVQWDRRMDGKIAQALMSVHTVKSVDIGLGSEVADTPGSKVHDQVYLNIEFKEDSSSLRYLRHSNNSGGFEGGMTNGEPIVCRAGVKPIPTIVSKLDSVDLETRSASKSHFERSDVCVVPAAGVVLEAMLAISITEAFIEKFGGDSIRETKRNYQSYLQQCSER